uniref:Uncharacterized protein n=1 Tax=Odontella aurita TaxID=265563 RepID=A0A6U6CXT8_9STRA|mmetsp:Transcript_16901/g.48811  ORF Transcript_16901/g.48811 Transcript_16901/m.48811 type:complete len:299 (+) Transcript_16901:407-1303(+)|eukprot:CAMPEP_0113529714 /NCGR_PEP_ID=MMETSP0015_2-20120614/2544_1 /TAXON_ID=2838 /ORGANISM="Odontella" /LENGTH=298 /DNA_ID=CAMNT_0000428369 /DNA_START=323 /DNA_END=1219 /DNA_ORIENTATION=+ /assembly_acc=CAM_ASM_000160
MSSINDELEAIEWSARGGKPTKGAPPGSSASRPAPGSGRGRGAVASTGPRRGSSQFLPPGAGRGAGRGQLDAGKNDAGSGDELLVDFPGSDDEHMDESDDDKYTGAPPTMKPGGGYGAQNFSTGAPPSFKMGGGPVPAGAGPRRGSGGMAMPPGHVPGAAGMNSGRYADDSDDSSEDYRGGGYGAGSNPPSYSVGGGGQPGYGGGGPPGYGGGGLPGNPMPVTHQVQPQQPRLGEAERMRLRQLQMQREASTKSGTADHRPLVGGFAAAAYEAARADHFTQKKTPASEGQRPRDLPSI